VSSITRIQTSAEEWHVISDKRQENGQIYEYIIHNSELRVNTTYTFYDLIYF